MKPLRLIFSSGGTPRFAEIAMRHGWLPGARLPCTVYADKLHFADNEYQDFERDPYVEAIKIHRPKLATLVDLERWDQIDEVIQLGKDIAPYVQEALIVIPKVNGIIKHLPREIGGLPVWLGYSIDTSNGGTKVPIREFEDWDVHLLGGSPQEQMRLAQGWTPRTDMALMLDAPVYNLNVVSVDTNYHQERANRHVAFWVNGTSRDKNRYFPRLSSIGNHTRQDGIYIAFEMSCINIMQAWRELGYAVNEPLAMVA
jgi:hypothetical protein